MKKVLAVLFCLVLLTIPSYAAIAGGVAINANGPSSAILGEEFEITLVADGTGITTLYGTIKVSDNVAYVQSALVMPSPWKLETQTSGQQIGFTLSDPTGKNTIDSQTDFMTITLKALSAGTARVDVTDVGGKDAGGGYDASDASYTIAIKQSTPSLAPLASLSSDTGTLSPSFSASVLHYTLTVPYETTKVTLSANAQDRNSTLSGTGVIPFTEQKKTVNIQITAKDNSTSTVTVQIVRDKKTQATPMPSVEPTQAESGGAALVVVMALFIVSISIIAIIVINLLRQRRRK